LCLALNETTIEGCIENRRMIAGELLVDDELCLPRADDESDNLAKLTGTTLAMGLRGSSE
jgi:hypothetical protein